MEWFRLHHRFFTSPKLRSFAFEDRYRLLMILWLASESNERGEIDLDAEDIAATLELEEAEYLQLEARFCRKGILDRTESGLVVCNWAEYQYDKPSDSPEATRARKQAQRERERNSDTSRPVTPMSRPVTPPVTPPEQSRAEQIQIRAEAVANARETTLSIVDTPPPAAPAEFWKADPESPDVGEVSGVREVPAAPPPRLPKSTNPGAPPHWWVKLTGEGWTPEEVTTAHRTATEERGKKAGEAGFEGYLRAMLPDIRARCDSAKPPPPVPQVDPEQERQEKQRQRDAEKAERDAEMERRAADLQERLARNGQLRKTQAVPPSFVG